MECSIFFDKKEFIRSCFPDCYHLFSRIARKKCISMEIIEKISFQTISLRGSLTPAAEISSVQYLRSNYFLVGQANGAILVFDQEGTCLAKSHAHSGRKIIAFAGLHMNHFASIDSCSKLRVWNIIGKKFSEVLCRKLDLANPKCLSCISPRGTDISLVSISSAKCILFIQLRHHKCGKVQFLDSFSMTFQWEISDMSVLHVRKSTDIASGIELLVALRFKVMKSFIIHVKIDEKSCTHSDISCINDYKTLGDCQEVDLSWCTDTEVPWAWNENSPALLCVRYNEAVAVYMVHSSGCSEMLSLRNVHSQAICWIDRQHILGFCLASSSAFTWSIQHKQIESFQLPRGSKTLSLLEQNKRLYAEKSKIQKFSTGIFILSLPEVQLFQMVYAKHYSNALQLHRANALKNYEKSIDAVIEDALIEADSLYATRAVGSSFNEYDRYIYFMPLSFVLLDYYFEGAGPESGIECIYKKFHARNIGPIFIYYLEFAIRSGRLSYLPNTFLDLFCERFLKSTHIYSTLEKIHVQNCINNGSGLAIVLKSGPIYRLEFCLSRIACDIGFLLRKAVSLELYRAMSVLYIVQLKDFTGLLRKLRTIGTAESLHAFMDFVLLASVGSVAPGQDLAIASIQAIKREAALHTLDISFREALMHVDAIKYLALCDLLLTDFAPDVQDQVINETSAVFHGKNSNFIPSKLQKSFWHILNLRYTLLGLVAPGDLVETLVVNLNITSARSWHHHNFHGQRQKYFPFFSEKYWSEKNVIADVFERELLASNVERFPVIEACNGFFADFILFPTHKGLELLRRFHSCMLVQYLIALPNTEEALSYIPEALQIKSPIFFAGKHLHVGKHMRFHWIVTANNRYAHQSALLCIDNLQHKCNDPSSNHLGHALFLHCVTHLFAKSREMEMSFARENNSSFHFVITKRLRENVEILTMYCEGFIQKVQPMKDAMALSRFGKNLFFEHENSDLCESMRIFSLAELLLMNVQTRESMWTFVHVVAKYRIIPREFAISMLSNCTSAQAYAFRTILLQRNDLILSFQLLREEVRKNSTGCEQSLQLGRMKCTSCSDVQIICGILFMMDTFCSHANNTVVDIEKLVHFAEILSEEFHDEEDIPGILQNDTLESIEHHTALLKRAQQCLDASNLNMLMHWKPLVPSFKPKQMAIRAILPQFITACILKALKKIPGFAICERSPLPLCTGMYSSMSEWKASNAEQLFKEFDSEQAKLTPLLSRFEESFQNCRVSQSVYVENDQKNVPQSVQQLAPAVKALSCGHIIESRKIYETCPLCQGFIEPMMNEVHRSKFIPTTSVEKRLSRFQELLSIPLLEK